MDAGTEDTSRYDSVVAAASEFVVGDATIPGGGLCSCTEYRTGSGMRASRVSQAGSEWTW